MLEAERALRGSHDGDAEQGPIDPHPSRDQPLVGLGTLARLFGVSGNQVYMWHQRRKANGFPEAVASVHIPRYPGDKRKAPLFDLMAVTEWWGRYDPNARKGAHWREKRGGKESWHSKDYARRKRAH